LNSGSEVINTRRLLTMGRVKGFDTALDINRWAAFREVIGKRRRFS
jgi:hypothetical protein